MSDVTIFQSNSVPDYLREVGVSELTKSLLSSSGGNGNKRISLRGKKFRLVVDGEELSTLKSDSMDIVIINANKDISRTYYSGAYDPKADAVPPDCWSKDGTVPDEAANAPQSVKCDGCKQNIKGSGNGDSRACSFSKRIAIAIAIDGEIENSVYQLTIPATSIFGDGSKNQMPFNKYVKYVGSQGFSIDTMLTTITFDEDSDFPKVYFDASRFLTKQEYLAASKLGSSPEAINAITMTVSQTDKVRGKEARENEFAKLPSKVVASADDVDEPTVRKAKKDDVPASSKPDLGDILSKFAKTTTQVADDE